MRTARWICLCLLAVLLIGCGESGNTDGAANRNKYRKSKAHKMQVVEVAAKDETRTLRHAGGTTENVPKRPRRVVALNTSDAAYFLGVTPVAETGQWDMGGKHYLDDYRKDVGRVSAAYGTRMATAESVMMFDPDLIVMDSLDGPTLQQMQKIAPTVVVTPGIASTSGECQVEEHTTDVGIALGIPERAQAALRWLRYKMELARRDMRTYLAAKYGDRNPVMTVLWPTGRTIRVYHYPALYGNGFGFAQPKPIPWVGKHFSPRIQVMDAEQLADIEAEYLVCISFNKRGQLPGRAELLGQNPLWEHVQAVRNDQILVGQVSQWVCEGPLGCSLCVNDLVQFVLPPEYQTPELRHMLKDRPDDSDIAEVAHWPSDRGMTSWIESAATTMESTKSRKGNKPSQPKGNSTTQRKGGQNT